MKLDLQAYKHTASRIWRWLLNKDIIIFLMFVGLVSIVWWGRSMSSSIDGNIRVQINYSGVEDRVLFATPLPTQITASIRDNGRQLRQINKSNLLLNIDISNLLTQQNGTLSITPDMLRQRLQDILPGSTIILHIQPENITTEYSLQDAKLVPIHLASNIQCAAQHQLKFPPQLSVDSIYIYGTQQALSSIHHISTDSLYISDLRDSITLTTTLLLPSTVRSTTQQVTVTCQAEQFTDKSFTLPIQVLNTPHGRRVRLFPANTEVKVRVGISQFNKVHPENFNAVCYYPQQKSESLTIEIQTNNPYISNIRCYPSSVEYIIERL